MQRFFLCKFLNTFYKNVELEEKILEHLDNRVRYTKSVLQQALLKILQRKHIDKVTVKELCEEAKINRGTFYLHYSTPNDILREIEKQFMEENMLLFQPYFNEGYEINYMAVLFGYILEHQDLARVLMGQNGNPRMMERMKELTRSGVVNGWCREFPNYSREHLDYVFDFIFAGSTRLILDWIDDNNGISTKELANRLDRLGHYCHLAIQEFH